MLLTDLTISWPEPSVRADPAGPLKEPICCVTPLTSSVAPVAIVRSVLVGSAVALAPLFPMTAPNSATTWLGVKAVL